MLEYDIHNLQRFLLAQEKDYETALYELNSGYKATHWIWYIFPQFSGLDIVLCQKITLYSLLKKRKHIYHIQHLEIDYSNHAELYYHTLRSTLPRLWDLQTL